MSILLWFLRLWIPPLLGLVVAALVGNLLGSIGLPIKDDTVQIGLLLLVGFPATIIAYRWVGKNYGFRL